MMIIMKIVIVAFSIFLFLIIYKDNMFFESLLYLTEVKITLLFTEMVLYRTTT